MTPSELARAYLEENAPSWTAVTRDSAARGLKPLLAFFSDKDLTRQAVLDYVREIRGRRTAKGTPWAAPTVAGVLVRARCFLKWAHLRGHRLEDLSALVPRVRVEQLPRGLSESEAARLIEEGPRGVCALRDRAALETLYGTGLRASELVRLHPDDVDLAAGLVHVRRGKGGRDRLVPLGERAGAAIHAYLRNERARAWGPLFLTVDGRALTSKALGSLVAEAGRRAGIGRLVSPHRLRHSYATHLLRRGASVVAIQALLGHARLSSTQVYLGCDALDLARTIARCHPRERDYRIGRW